MQRPFKAGFWGNEKGATAALYALALPVLVAVAGIGFDYAQIAAMDTELQNAADQAALAGATQLDQTAGSMARATGAARGGLVTNSTYFANDGGDAAVDIPEGSVFFYATRANAEAGTNALDASNPANDANARFIRVAVETRTANYTLTPVVGAFSGDIDAEAVAGIGAALCRTPPLMICNPNEPLNNNDSDFPFDPDAFQGKGLLLKGGGGNSWAPGNFGFLDTIPGNGGGTPDLRKSLGWNTPPGECISQSANEGVDTETGNKTDLADSINTRFDIYEGNTACPSGGLCAASVNSVKDFVHPDSLTGGQACRVHNNGWKQVALSGRYLPPTNAPLPTTVTPTSMGHPRDICHATPSNQCAGAGAFGDGVWDRNAYFRTNYNWTAAQWPTASYTNLGSSPSRYEVYTWEIANRGMTINGAKVLGGPSAVSAYGSPVCSAGKGYGSGQVPATNVSDRRRLSVAVINCEAENVAGKSLDKRVTAFMDIFLVQPSLDRDRTAKDEIYVEVIGQTAAGSAGETAGTVVRRDVPYLIR
ncbi:pilus assembly protein TadG-related protein [Altererythrobacter aquiaggeris]|uniref:pilus assembly protein TadG-related protein n=1 Tax=Aestuarierythrobacter aquiaggeris TaxID=1898396 RepID=UPI00301AB39C